MRSRGVRWSSRAHSSGRVICLDQFHIVKAATDALAEIRREVWNKPSRAGHEELARELKGARFVLWKSASNLTARQKLQLASIQHTNKRRYRAYLLAQQLREGARSCNREPHDARDDDQHARLSARLATRRRKLRFLFSASGFGYPSEAGGLDDLSKVLIKPRLLRHQLSSLDRPRRLLRDHSLKLGTRQAS
jgi:hypothetical protein